MKKRLNQLKCHLGYWLRWAKEPGIRWGPDSHMWRGNIFRAKGAAQDMPRHVLRLMCSKRLSRGQHRYGVDASLGVLDGMYVGATWRIRLNRLCTSAMRPYVKLLFSTALYVCVHCCWLLLLHTFNGLVSRTTWVSWHRNHSGFYWSKRWSGGSSISWTTWKPFVSHSRHITMSAPHHSFL